MKKVLFFTAIAIVIIFSVMLVADANIVTDVSGIENGIALDENGVVYAVRNEDNRSILYAIDKTGTFKHLYVENSTFGSQKSYLDNVLCVGNQVIVVRQTMDIVTNSVVKQEICEFISLSDFGGFMRPIYTYDGANLVPIKSLASDNTYLNVVSISDTDEKVFVDQIDFMSEQPTVVNSIKKAAPFNNGLYQAAYVNNALVGITKCGELVRFDGQTCNIVYDGNGSDTAILFLAPYKDGVAFVNMLTKRAYTYIVETNTLESLPYQDFSAGADPQNTNIIAAAMQSKNNFACIRVDGDENVTMLLNNESKTSIVHDLKMPLMLNIKFSLTPTLLYTLIFFAALMLIWLIWFINKNLRRVLVKFMLITIPVVAALFVAFGLIQQFMMRETMLETRFTLSHEINSQTLKRLPVDTIARINSPGFYKTADYRQLRSIVKTGDSIGTSGILVQNEVVVVNNGTLHTGVSAGLPCYYEAELAYAGNGTVELMHKALDGINTVNDVLPSRLGMWNTTIAPIQDTTGNVVGLLLTMVSTGDIESQLSENMMQYAIVTGITLLLLTIFILITFRMALRPLKQLEVAVSRVASGDYSTGLTVKSNDEFYDISRVFNKMCEELSSHIYKLNSLSKSYYRFVPRNVYGILGKESILDVNFGDMAAIDAVFAITSLNNRDKIRAEHDDNEFMEFTNRYFSVIYDHIEKNKGLLLSNDFNMSVLLSVYRSSGDSAMSYAIDLLNMLAGGSVAGSGIYADTTIMLHDSRLLYGIAGTEARVFPFTTSTEADYLGELTQKFKYMGTKLVVTKQVLDSLKKPYTTRCIGFVHTPDAKNTYQLYEVLDVYDSQSLKTRTDVIPVFDKALALFYDADFYGARNLFSAILRSCPDDGIARWYLFACDKYFTAGSGDGFGYELFGQNENVFK